MNPPTIVAEPPVSSIGVRDPDRVADHLESWSAAPKPPSDAAVARKAQIVRAAIETISQLGLGRASYKRIAERAGIPSTGLITYHFDSREDLIDHVVGAVYDEMAEYMSDRVTGQATATGALEAYIRGIAGFMRERPVATRALLAVYLGGALDRDNASGAPAGPLEHMLRAGQRAGEFRQFDARVMATAIQRSLDGLPFLAAAEPELDTEAYAEELVEMFVRATRA
ncbi:TetR/AcrR family transcriptional regulator [Thermoleophilia bacterium SCSIO 60948]|nr:TetR/AcrR family transcriptional regulator [Thermoleophilia bacterium SCSIO 60948]